SEIIRILCSFYLSAALLSTTSRFPYTTLFRSQGVMLMFIHDVDEEVSMRTLAIRDAEALFQLTDQSRDHLREWLPWVDETKTIEDRKSTRLNSSHVSTSYAVFCLKKKTTINKN